MYECVSSLKMLAFLCPSFISPFATLFVRNRSLREDPKTFAPDFEVGTDKGRSQKLRTQKLRGWALRWKPVNGCSDSCISVWPCHLS